MIPVIAARVRRHRQIEVILAVVIIWALLAAVSVGHAITAQIDWNKEYQLRVETGYYDPQNKGDAPAWPLGSWALLGLGYAVIAAWALAGKSRAGAGQPG